MRPSIDKVVAAGLSPYLVDAGFSSSLNVHMFDDELDNEEEQEQWCVGVATMAHIPDLV